MSERYGRRALAAVALSLAAVVGSQVVIAPRGSLEPPRELIPSPRLALGTDPHELDLLASHGVNPDLVQVWVGAWLERAGWDAVDHTLATTRERGITPVIQFYYWGDDLTQECFDLGCRTGDGVVKDRAGWDRAAGALGRHLRSQLAGDPAVIVLETEFNKELAESEALDGALAAKAVELRAAYPAARVALGFGNWGHASWVTFDRAAAASDELSLQLLRASTRNDLVAYRASADHLLHGARELQRLFGKPILVSDVALSTYGGDAFVTAQRDVLADLFDRTAELQEAGVYGVVYRSVLDAGGAPLGYFGQAERHFGLFWSGNRTAKPAFHEFWAGATVAG